MCGTTLVWIASVGVAGLSTANELGRPTLSVAALSCDGCLAAFKLQLERTEGVTASEVSLEKREASVTYDPEKTDAGMIGESLLKNGFDVRLAPWEPVD